MVELHHGTLSRVQPSDVVVAPIINKTGQVDDIPGIELRRAFQSSLIARFYSAMALPYTDLRVRDAAYKPGSLYEDAVLQIVVNKWDLARWEEHREVVVDLEAWMLAPTDSTQLWGGQFKKTFYLGREMAHLATEKGAFAETAQLIATELLEIMPARVRQP